MPSEKRVGSIKKLTGPVYPVFPSHVRELVWNGIEHGDAVSVKPAPGKRTKTRNRSTYVFQSHNTDAQGRTYVEVIEQKGPRGPRLTRAFAPERVTFLRKGKRNIDAADPAF